MENELVEMKIEGKKISRRKALTFIEIIAALGIAAVVALGIWGIATFLMKNTRDKVPDFVGNPEQTSEFSNPIGK